MLRLYNSLKRKKELFIPRVKKKVSLYVCGITPYDTTHLGHAFTYISFDAFIRYLQYKGYNVTYVQNVTDIDDDILKRAKEVKKNWRSLGNFWTKRFLSDLKALNVLPPTHYVRATDSIPKIIEIVEVLEKKGFAYESGGKIFFSVKKSPGYGGLSGFTRQQMQQIAAERGGDVKDPLKKDSLDFLLWQKSLKGEPSWESPFGKGRPGWHIECSAMVHQYLGQQIDIHGGGRDLIFPHHESEIAQSENFTSKKPYVKYWMHTAMLLYQGEKMSKSLGNLIMVNDLLKKYSPNAIRFMLLSHHYRDPWEYFDYQMQEAAEAVGRVEKALALRGRGERPDASSIVQFEKLLDDDFNTPLVVRLLVSLADSLLQEKDSKKKEALSQTLFVLWEVLGFGGKV